MVKPNPAAYRADIVNPLIRRNCRYNRFGGEADRNSRAENGDGAVAGRNTLNVRLDTSDEVVGEL